MAEPRKQADGSGLTAFEVQVLSGGQWRLEASFTTRAEAESEAMRCYSSSRRPLAVRVVRESVDPSTNLIRSKTVFMQTRPEEEERRRKLAESRETQARPSSAGYAPSGRPGAPSESEAALPGWAWGVLVGAVALLGGVLVLYRLHGG